MGSSIQPLNTDSVQQIAAGEVIDSLAAVVRELVENALDAAARRIQIQVWPEAGRIQVADNGMGLTLDDLYAAALPHTTSKLSSIQQLHTLKTYGFRGEALHSMARLGHLEIWSRPQAIAQTQAEGWRVVYNAQGQVATVEESAIAPGTVVTVSQLFRDWPLRRQKLSPTRQLKRLLQELIGDYALCHPQVTWRVTLGQERPSLSSPSDWLQLAPTASPQETLLQLLKPLSAADLQSATYGLPDPALTPSLGSQPLTLQDSKIAGQLDLVIGLPDRHHRRRPDWVRIAVNGRRIWTTAETPAPTSSAAGSLEQAIGQAFQHLLPRYRHPLCWLHLQLPAPYIDWNRTASKRSIYLDSFPFWQQYVTQCLQHLLATHEMAQLAEPTSRVVQMLKSAERQGHYFADPHFTSPHFTSPHLATPPLNLSSPLPTPEADLPPTASPLPPAETLTQGSLRVIAQLHQTYILAEHTTGLWLIEQHVAHERVLFEQLRAAWGFVELETPLVLRQLSDRQVHNLQQLGFPLEPFGDHWLLRQVPQLLDPCPDRLEILQDLSRCSGIEPAMVAIACRTAIKNNTPLTLPEMQTLLERWQQTQQPRTCPHGRPIYLCLEKQAIARIFRRNWILGNR